MTAVLPRCPWCVRSRSSPDMGQLTRGKTSQLPLSVFAYPRNEIAGQGFIRTVDGSISPHGIPSDHDDLWRVGLALTDFLDLLEESREVGRQTSLTPKSVFQDSQSWATTSILTHSLYRLRGQGPVSRNPTLDAQTSLPQSIERVLTRLEKFSLSGDATPAHRFALAVAAHCERKVAGWLFQNRGAIEATFSPGRLAKLLVDTSMQPWQDDRILATELPPVSGCPTMEAMRRPVAAWLGLSYRIEALMNQAGPIGEDGTILATVSARPSCSRR